jgi:hypothetical protein
MDYLEESEVMTWENQVSRRSVLRAGGLGVLATGAGLVAMQTAQGQDKGDRRRHPRLARAIEEHTHARDYQRNAPNNYRGHNPKAIEAIEAAIEQLRLAIRF